MTINIPQINFEFFKKNYFKDLIKPRIFSIPIILAIVVYFILQLIISGLLIYVFLINYSESQLTQTVNQIVSDISYHNGTWNISRYNSDPDIPERFPLYIISTQGIILDRMNVIHNYLDKSSIFRLNIYSTPKTVNTIANESWRVYSKQIEINGNLWGTVLVAKYDPDTSNLKTTDSQLYKNADKLIKQLQIQNNQLDVSMVNASSFDYHISFEVIDQFNNILFKSNNINSNNKLPDYIDRSYVGNVLISPVYSQIYDTSIHQTFLIKHKKIEDKNGNPIAIVSVGLPIDYIYQLIQFLVLIELITGIFLLVILTTFIHNSINIYIFKFLKKNNIDFYDPKKITKICFSKKEHSIFINDKPVNIPFATNQYYFCEALFANPTKKWETDELLDKFGEHDLGKWHKVYDTMKLINKRLVYILPDKLFIINNKRFQINPIFQKLIEYNK